MKISEVDGMPQLNSLEEIGYFSFFWVVLGFIRSRESKLH